MKVHLLLWCFIGCIWDTPSRSVFAQTPDSLTAKDLTMLSFDDLMRVKITSVTLTGVETIQSPGAITTISREEILSTPHRNLMDLLEVYVPGANYVNHWLGPRIGIRGVMSDQNYSYLLLVNGENMNMQTESGPFFEILNKDLADIEKIEIIRGPGSVIHGPGAIGGVISITTQNAATADKANIGISRNIQYRYSILHGSYSVKAKDISAYLFASIGRSDGIENPEFYYIDRAHGYGYGYLSESWGYKGLGGVAPQFYADFQQRPEIKAHLNIDVLKEFTIDARYTTFSFIKQQQQSASQEGPAFPGLYGQQFTSLIKNNHEFSEKTQLVSNASFQSQSSGDIALYQGAGKPLNDITQRRTSYSENKLTLRSIVSDQPFEELKLAAGLEYNYWYYAPEWGKTKNSFIMDFVAPVKFAVLDTTSGFYRAYNAGGLVTLINNTIDAHQISGIFEVNYQLSKFSKLLVSGRVDKHNLADAAFSPRIALLQQLDQNNYLKFIAQQSIRLPGFRELYGVDYFPGGRSAPEKLRGVEILYSRIQGDNISMNASVFYQSIDQMAWTADDRYGFVGTFGTAGFEGDISGKIDNVHFVVSYSYLRQIGWKPVVEFNTYLNNIGTDSIKVPLTDAGKNRINNMPQHQIKFVVSYSTSKSLYIHLDGRFAAQQGQLDMLDMFKAAHDEYGTRVTRQEMNNIYDDVMDKGYGKPSFTSNFSIRYTLPFNALDISLSAWVMNLIAVNHTRYVYQFWEDGNNRQYPRQVGFVNEPLTIGMKLELHY